MINEQKSIILYNPEAKVFLEYDLSKLQAIIDTLRLETGSFSAEMLREYEHTLIEADRLDKDRLQREYEARRIQENANQVETKERTSDD